ncbi:MAG: type II secretion system protein [Methylobacillus sp.]|jgi:type IV pilus assembly protein PilA|nr:type II secretion system protein [Methylobacillus sp.]
MEQEKKGLSVPIILLIIAIPLLLVVLAVIGILAAIAIPAYQDYTVRAKVMEGMARAERAKSAIAEFYARTGHLPANAAIAGFDSSASGNVQSVTWDPEATGEASVESMGDIVVTMSPKISPNNASYTFYVSLVSIENGLPIWECNIGNAPRLEANSDGTLPRRYTPISCRPDPAR